MRVVSKLGAAALGLSTVEVGEAELPEAELEGVATELATKLVLFEGTPEELGAAVEYEVIVAEYVKESDGLDVVLVVLDGSK